MAKKFKSREKEIIKKTLLEQGRRLFARNGLKQTSVSQLTRAAGIGQGSFYIFHDSKEDLYFEILEREEDEISRALHELLQEPGLTRRRLKQIIFQSLEMLQANDLIRNLLENDEYQQIIRKIPEDKVRKHLDNETRLVAAAVNHHQEAGRLNKIKPSVLRGLFHGLFILYLHSSDIGEAVFPEMMELLIGAISDELACKGARNSSLGESPYLG